MGAASKYRAKLNDAKTSKNFKYFEPHPDGSRATYKVKVKKVHIVEPRNDGPAMFVAEHTILESELPTHRAGTDCSFVQKLNKDMAGSNIKGYFIATSGLTGKDEEIAEQDWDVYQELALEDDQPLTGTVLIVECERKEGKTAVKNPKTGQVEFITYVLCSFYPAE